MIFATCIMCLLVGLWLYETLHLDFCRRRVCKFVLQSNLTLTFSYWLFSFLVLLPKTGGSAFEDHIVSIIGDCLRSPNVFTLMRMVIDFANLTLTWSGFCL